MKNIGESPKPTTEAVQTRVQIKEARKDREFEMRKKRITDVLREFTEAEDEVPHYLRDVVTFYNYDKPAFLRKKLKDFTTEDLDELLDLLWSKNNAIETRAAAKTRPWSVHVQRVYFSVMPQGMGPSFEKAPSSLAAERIGLFMQAIRDLREGKPASDDSLYPFDREYFAEFGFGREQYGELLGMFAEDLDFFAKPHVKGEPQSQGEVLKRYRAITGLCVQSYQHDDSPGLMAISRYKGRANHLNDIIGSLKRFLRDETAYGSTRHELYEDYTDDQLKELIAMFENEKMLLVDLAKLIPSTAGLNNDVSDEEEAMMD